MTDEIVGSHETANNGYGQNGYSGPSSDLPGQATRSNRDYGLAADPVVDKARDSHQQEGANWQTRDPMRAGSKYKTGAVSPAFGHVSPGPNPYASQREPASIPDANIRRPRVQAAKGSFQR